MEVRRPFKVSNLLYCQEMSHLLLSLCSLTKLWPRYHLWNWSPQYDAHCCQGNPADRRESMCSHIMCSTEKPISEASSFELISARNLWLSLFLLWLAQPAPCYIPTFPDSPQALDLQTWITFTLYLSLIQTYKSYCPCLPVSLSCISSRFSRGVTCGTWTTMGAS